MTCEPAAHALHWTEIVSYVFSLCFRSGGPTTATMSAGKIPTLSDLDDDLPPTPFEFAMMHRYRTLPASNK